MVAIVNKGGGAPQTSGRGSNQAPRRFWGRLFKTLHDFIKRERYEPARHYMRGPGPKSSQRSNRIDRDAE